MRRVEQRAIEVWADWADLRSAKRMGILYATPVRSKEVFSFEYDTEWLKGGQALSLDPSLQLVGGAQYPAHDQKNFGLFLDSSPDRWGRKLMERREAQGSTVTAVYSYGNSLTRKDGEFPMLDGHGSERTVTNSSQAVTGTLNLDAFGVQAGSTGSSANPYMYATTAGYRNDGDAGLSLVGARYYDAAVRPAMGRVSPALAD